MRITPTERLGLYRKAAELVAEAMEATDQAKRKRLLAEAQALTDRAERSEGRQRLATHRTELTALLTAPTRRC